MRERETSKYTNTLVPRILKMRADCNSNKWQDPRSDCPTKAIPPPPVMMTTTTTTQGFLFSSQLNHLHREPQRHIIVSHCAARGYALVFFSEFFTERNECNAKCISCALAINIHSPFILLSYIHSLTSSSSLRKTPPSSCCCCGCWSYSLLCLRTFLLACLSTLRWLLLLLVRCSLFVVACGSPKVFNNQLVLLVRSDGT